jgi:type I restriction enzyme R subunit
VDDNGEIDYEDYIREEIKSRGQQNHISFFGFTGTPKEKTLEIFGTKHEDGSFRPFHQYTMYQSIHEGFTLDVIQNYTTFKRYFKIKNTQQEDIEIPSSEGKKELITYVDSHEQTIRMKVGVILDHFINKGSKEIEGKSRGMIVVRSRKNCVKYFREVNKQLEERGLSYRSLVGFSSDILGETEVSLNREIGHKGYIPLGFKNPKYRLLIVSNKFQLGFDEPLLQSMYIDKKLGGVQCVQTLSRLNRVVKGKTHSFVLDFVNSMEEVIESFQKYYTTTLLTEETDPNKLYDYQTLISEYHLFTPEDLNRFCEVFFEKDRDDGDLQPLLNQVVEQYERIDEQDKKEEFKSLIQSYMRLYGYISQIMTFKDIELEKLFIFLRYLNKKLPKGDKERIDISSSVDLDSLRIQKTFEGGGELDSEQQGELDPLGFEQGILVEDELELLSQIINRVNETYGSNLSEEDKIDLLNLSKRVDDNEELKTIMEGDSSMTNKKQYFKDTIDRILLSYVNERFDFYKKMEDQRVKGFVVNSLYENYTRNLNQETIG